MLHHVRRAAVISTLSVIVVAAVWSGLWLVAAAQYKHVLDSWVEAGRANGYQITYGERRLFGFPRHVVLRFQNIEWRNDTNILFHADDIDIAATPWQWSKFDAKFKKLVRITAPVDAEGHSLVLGGIDGTAHVELDDQGFWSKARISLMEAEVGRTPDDLIHADKLTVSGERPLTPPDNHKEAGLTLTGMAENVKLPTSIPSPFGPEMKKLELDVRVMGAVPDFRRRESVEAWNKTSGVVEFDRLHTEWGPLVLTAKGTMGFDDDLQPEGAFSAALSNQEEVLKALAAAGFIAERQQAMLDSALQLFAKPSRFGHADSIELPVAVQLGGLFLGPVRIFMYPPIQWPEGLPPAPAAAAPEQGALPMPTSTIAPTPDAAPSPPAVEAAPTSVAPASTAPATQQ